MICTLSKQHAEANGYNDALMFDWRGRVAEDVVWAKLATLAEGARIATRRLFG